MRICRPRRWDIPPRGTLVSDGPHALRRKRGDEFCDLAAAGAAVGPRLQPHSDSRDGSETLCRGLDDLVPADLEAGADGRAAIALTRVWSSGEKAQAILGRDALAQTSGKPRTGDDRRLARGEQRAGQSLALERNEAALAGRNVVIGDDLRVVAEAKRLLREARPVRRLAEACKFRTPAATSRRKGEIIGAPGFDPRARYGEGVPGRLVSPGRDRRDLQLRLAGDGVHRGADQSVDGRSRSELVRPVHRRK